ncbi:MAG: hypothetical protein VB089_13600 [Anaerolineaceae bacterium]|nr:hypothetical protein [Anaerolineaceae bacterium]
MKIFLIAGIVIIVGLVVLAYAITWLVNILERIEEEQDRDG